MVRAVLGVIVSFIAIQAVVIAGIVALYFVLGADGAFKAGSWDASMVWLLSVFAIGLVAAVAGGALCRAIAKKRGAVLALAIVILVMGGVMTLGQLGREAPTEARGPDISFFDAGQKAVQPMWVTLANPVIGCVGVLLGGRWRPAGGGSSSPGT